MRKSPLWCRDGATLNTSEIRAICPTIHHRNFKYQTQLGGKYTVYTAFSQASTVLIQYDSVPGRQSKQCWFTALAKERWCHFPSWILDSSRGRHAKSSVRSHAWVGRRRRSNFRWSKAYSLPGPQWPHDCCWNFGGPSFGNPAWDSPVKRIYFRKKVFKLNPWMGSQNGKVALPNHQFLAEPRSPQWFRISETHFSSPKTWP